MSLLTVFALDRGDYTVWIMATMDGLNGPNARRLLRHRTYTVPSSPVSGFIVPVGWASGSTRESNHG